MHTRTLGAAVSAAALLLIAASATAATAADDDTEYISYSSEWFTGHLSSALSDGVFTISTDTIAPEQAVAMELDADGRGYAISYADHGLYRVAIGEEPEFIAYPTHMGDPSDCRGLDYSHGTLYASCTDNQHPGQYMLAVVNTVTGELTRDMALPAEIAAIALDPITGDWWFFAHMGDLYISDHVNSVWQGAIPRVWGADFDATGRLWVTPSDLGGELNGREVVSIAVPSDDGIWFESITVLARAAEEAEPQPEPETEAEPELAATGFETTLLLGTSSAALLAGAAAVVAARLRRTTAS